MRVPAASKGGMCCGSSQTWILCFFFFFLLLGFLAFSTVSPSGSEITWHLRNYVALKTNPVDLLVRENPLSADKRCCILRKMGAN